MEFPCNPLNRELLEQQQSSTQEDCEQEFSNEIDGIQRTTAGTGTLPAVNQWVPGDPIHKSPNE
jgi:hypothetical protein